MPMTIQQVIQNNSWGSVNFNQSSNVMRLYQSGMVTGSGVAAERMINALDFDNVQDTIQLGFTGYPWAEQNFGDASDTVAAALQPFFETQIVKTFYGNMWWEVSGIQQDLLSASKPKRLVLEHVGKYWGTMWNKLLSATISGMSDIAAITVGNGTQDLSRKMVIDARKKKGDLGFGKLATMYMSSTTLADILTKQAASESAESLITEHYETYRVSEGNISREVKAETPKYLYCGVTPVVIDDAMTDGIISLVDDYAFVLQPKKLANALMYDENARSGNGVGKKQWGTRMLYVLHPTGFSFKGRRGVDYSSASGLTIAELSGGGLYELSVDPKFSPIINLKIRIGAAAAAAA